MNKQDLLAISELGRKFVIKHMEHNVAYSYNNVDEVKVVCLDCLLTNKNYSPPSICIGCALQSKDSKDHLIQCSWLRH